MDPRANTEAEEMIYDIIRHGDAEDAVEDEISSFLNASGDGMEERSDADDEERIVVPLIKSVEVHILSPLVTRCIK
jgi:hypothetical protein